jgi:hypothetical protein
MANPLDKEGHELNQLLTEFIEQNQSTNSVSSRRGSKINQLILSQRTHINTGLPGIDNELNPFEGDKDSFQAS